jgi:hypothetical protein
VKTKKDLTREIHLDSHSPYVYIYARHTCACDVYAFFGALSWGLELWVQVNKKWILQVSDNTIELKLTQISWSRPIFPFWPLASNIKWTTSMLCSVMWKRKYIHVNLQMVSIVNSRSHSAKLVQKPICNRIQDIPLKNLHSGTIITDCYRSIKIFQFVNRIICFLSISIDWMAVVLFPVHQLHHHHHHRIIIHFLALTWTEIFFTSLTNNLKFIITTSFFCDVRKNVCHHKMNNSRQKKKKRQKTVYEDRGKKGLVIRCDSFHYMRRLFIKSECLNNVYLVCREIFCWCFWGSNQGSLDFATHMCISYSQEVLDF